MFLLNDGHSNEIFECNLPKLQTSLTKKQKTCVEEKLIYCLKMKFIRKKCVIHRCYGLNAISKL